MSLPASHSGAGPRVLLLHSGFCTWVEWRSTIALLEPEREVLAPTLPGSRGGPDSTYATAACSPPSRTTPRPAKRVVVLAPPWAATGQGMAYYMALFSPLLTMRLAEPF